MNDRQRAVLRELPWLAVVLVAWLCDERFGAWLAGNCESAAPWHYLCADLGPWDEFFRRAQDGVPYVDFSREYPAGIVTIFWALGELWGVQGIADTTRLHIGLSLASDALCAGLVYAVVRPHGALRASLSATAWLLLPTAFVLSPVRYESLVCAAVLLGYLLHVRGRYAWAAAVWSFGITLKWYPIIAIAIQELAVLDRDYLKRRLWQVLGVTLAVQLLVNGPYLIGSLVVNGHIDPWLATYTFHADRRLGVDTVLGVIALWIGRLEGNQYAAWFSIALALLVLLTRRTMAFEAKFVLVCIALLLLNRVYSPQFNLWFYPFLLLVIASQGRARALGFGALLLIVDLTTVAIFPFLYAAIVYELHGDLPWGAMAAYGATFSEAFTSAVFLRAFALLALMAGLYAAFPREADA